MAETLASLKQKGGGSKDYALMSASANTNNTVNSSTDYTTNSDLYTVTGSNSNRTHSLTVKKGGNYHYAIWATARGTGTTFSCSIGSTSIPFSEGQTEGDISIGDNTVCTITASCTNNLFANINFMIIQK